MAAAPKAEALDERRESVQASSLAWFSLPQICTLTFP